MGRGPLEIAPGSQLDLHGRRLYVRGDVRDLLSAYAANGRIIERTVPGAPLHIGYLPGRQSTLIGPEPSAPGILTLGGFPLFRRKRGIRPHACA